MTKCRNIVYILKDNGVVRCNQCEKHPLEGKIFVFICPSGGQETSMGDDVQGETRHCERP